MVDEIELALHGFSFSAVIGGVSHVGLAVVPVVLTLLADGRGLKIVTVVDARRRGGVGREWIRGGLTRWTVHETAGWGVVREGNDH